MFSAKFVESILLMLVLFNPFLLTVYLIEVIRSLDLSTFARVLARAFAISAVVFSIFAVGGDALFTHVLQARFESFLIFGGVVLTLIAVRYVVFGVPVMTELRGKPEHLAGTIAMPFLIGPGTVSASVLIGSRLPVPAALVAILVALAFSCAALIALKAIHDRVRDRNEEVVERYVEAIGRASALVIGTLSVDMVLTGLERWMEP